GRCPVYIRVSDTDGRKLKATGILVTERQWNPNKERVRDGVNNADQHNAKIVRMLAAAEREKAKKDLEGAVATTADLAAAIDENAPVKRDEVPTILSEYKRFVDSKRARYRPNTIKVYEALEGHFKEWLSPTDRISDITSEFLHDFGTFLIGKGLANVTVNKYVKRARGFTIWLEKRDKIERAPHAERLPTAQNSPVYLTLDELQTLAGYDLSGKPAGYQDARDLFVAEALTG